MAGPSSVEEEKRIGILLRLVSEDEEAVIEYLKSNPEYASKADKQGYSLLHAACGYTKKKLMGVLLNDYGVQIDRVDEEGDPPLAQAETVIAAAFLVENGANLTLKNNEGQTPFDVIRDLADENTQDGHDLLAYIESIEKPSANGSSSVATSSSHVPTDTIEDVHAPPPLPEGMQINFGTMIEDESQMPDPTFRSKIEEFAQREDFHSAKNQDELRSLVTEIVKGVAVDQNQDRDVRQRVE